MGLYLTKLYAFQLTITTWYLHNHMCWCDLCFQIGRLLQIKELWAVNGKLASYLYAVLINVNYWLYCALDFNTYFGKYRRTDVSRSKTIPL